MEYFDVLLGEDFDYDVFDVLDGLKDLRGDWVRILCFNDCLMVYVEEFVCLVFGIFFIKEDVRLGILEG